MSTDFANLRREYEAAPLDEASVGDDPVAHLTSWLEEAIAAGEPDANAMVLATATASGRPSARVVLLKQIDERGLVFFGNYKSRKGRELAANPYAAVDLYWPLLHRQARVEGEVGRLSRDVSAEYFASRPRGSQLAAWASPQSAPVADRAELERLWAEAERRFPEGDVPLPEDWGGWRLVPESIELWQGRPNRLHDRLRFRRGAGRRWEAERLAP